ncbi:uncharacterized protein LOC125765968 [Anopheles funestus]|uniref:uncharacterized protein LOC125765968 n=1 Tax=Anopheles funestus TaxID=62324 RepID=UPI0020C5F9FB|nr:uncharacterized protein LOC125765968 [Anopheles funestus]XP_049287499.1 uncharacterized protein LOC125765968 [Anopheles funestus]XP_049287508.1 uncharacterized protein LOC125765968 [Anopheles funestus]XP_049287515.1 uncharacterized protein LOC125765968 [Anopheles funestus]
MAIECPVCTLFLRSGMSLAEHLDTHPKENVIKALVSRVKHDVVGYYPGTLEELGTDEIIPAAGNATSIGTTASASSNALTIRTNERTTSLGIYDTQPAVYMDNAILAASSSAVQATVSQPPQFAVVKAIDAHGIPSFQLNNVTLIKREMVQPVATVSALSTITTVASAQPATIGTMQTADLSGIGTLGEDYTESSGNGNGEAGSSRTTGPTVASATFYPRYTNELYSGPPPPYSRAISSTIATNTQITPIQHQTVQLTVPKSSVGVVAQQIQLVPKLHTEASNSAFKQYASAQTVTERGVDEGAVTANPPPVPTTPKHAYGAATATNIGTRVVAATSNTITSSTGGSAASTEQSLTAITSKANLLSTPSPKANVVKVISNVKVQSKLKDIQEIILQLNAGQMSIVGDKTTLIPPTTERRPSTFATSAPGRSLLAIAPKTECTTEEQNQQQANMPGSVEISDDQNDIEHMATDYDHEEVYSDAWQDEDNYADEEIREQWEDEQGESKRFASGDEQGELHSVQQGSELKSASVTAAATNTNTNSTAISNAMVTSVIRKTPQPLPCSPSPIQQQIKRLVFRMTGNTTPTTVTISPSSGPSTPPKIVRAWQGIKLECSPEGTSPPNNATNNNTTTTTAVSTPAEEEIGKSFSCASSALAGRDYVSRQKQRFRPPKKLAIKPKRTQPQDGESQRAADGGEVAVHDQDEMVGMNPAWSGMPSATIELATALNTLAEVVCTNAAQQQQPRTEPFSSTSFNGITAVIQKTDANSGIVAHTSSTVPVHAYRPPDDEKLEHHPLASSTPNSCYVTMENHTLHTQQLLMKPIKQEYTRLVDNAPSAAHTSAKPSIKSNQLHDAAIDGHKPSHPKEEIDVGAYNISYVNEAGETIYHPLPRIRNRAIESPRRDTIAEQVQRRLMERDGRIELMAEDVTDCAPLQGEEEEEEAEVEEDEEAEEDEEEDEDEPEEMEEEDEEEEEERCNVKKMDGNEMIEGDEDDEKEVDDDMDQEANVVYEEQLDSDEDEYDNVFQEDPIGHPEPKRSASPIPSDQPDREQLLMMLSRVKSDKSDAVDPLSITDMKNESIAGMQEGSMQPYSKSDDANNLPGSLVMKRFHSGIITTDDEKDLLEAGPSSRKIEHVGGTRSKMRAANVSTRKADRDEQRKKAETLKGKCGKDFHEAGPSSSSSPRFAGGSMYEHTEEGCMGHHSFNNSTTTIANADEQMSPQSMIGLKTAKTEPYAEDEMDTSTSSFLDMSTIPKNSFDGMTNDTASNTSNSTSQSAGLGKEHGEGSGISGGTRSLLPSGSSIASTSMERAPSTESLNIRTDEKMPAKGEISEQESNGDMDVTSWNHRMYAVGENVPIYPSSYDLSTAQECWNLSSRNQGMFAVTDHFYHQQQHSGGNNAHATTVSNQYINSRVSFQFSSTTHQHHQQHGADLPFGGGIMTGKVEPQQDDNNDSDDVDEQTEGRRLKNAIPKMPFADMMVARIHEPPGAYDEVVTHHHHHHHHHQQQQQTCETKYDTSAGTPSYFGVAAAGCSTLPLMSGEVEPVLSSRPKPSGSGVPRTFRCTLCPKVFDTIKQRRQHQQREHATELLALSSHTTQEQANERNGAGMQQQQQQQQQQVYKKQPIPVVMNYDWMKQEIQRKSEATLKSSRMLMPDGSSSSAVPGTSGEELLQQQLVVAQVQVQPDGSTTDGAALMRDGMLPSACTVAARNRTYVCGTCHQKFDRFNLFNEHLNVHPVHCVTCGRHFKQWRNFSLHIKRHLGIKEHQCRNCGKQFVIKQKLIEHMRVHTGHAPIKCKLCNRTFKRFSNLAQHRKRYHLNRTVTKEDYVCQLCGEVFHTQAKMEWHKETHEKKPKSCPYCREKFIHRNSLTRHIRLSHTDKYAKLENKTEPCSICQQPYTKTSMRRHMETHTKERMAFACGICNKRFTTNWNLKQHKWTHANPTMKPFQCTYCPSAFVRESDFVTHVNAHRSIRPYTCNHCGSQFIRKYNWIRHTREHEIDKGHRCDVCGRQFHRKYYLTEHKRIHTGERPFACNICGKTSATKTNHNKHVRIHHARDPLTAEG